ncbi:MAG: hypothetical protein JST00_03955 [Deltaproteobacteria bacterium]|nr:hypothetical protein [Deltaproteobacteria bacterium]
MAQGPFNPYMPPSPQQGYPPGPPGYPPPGGPMGYEYEFSDEENRGIASAAFWARLLAIFLIITGVASLVNCNIVAFGIDLGIGLTFLGAASSLTAVVNTQGNDIQHMMTALGKLGSAFKIRVFVTLAAVVLVFVIGLILTLVLIGSAASS